MKTGRIVALFLSFVLILGLFPAQTFAQEEKVYDSYYLGDFYLNATTPIPLGARFKGVVKFEYDLHVKANITASNNAVVFGGDGLSAWAGVGAALYINSSRGGSENVFYTQNARGDGNDIVHNSTLTWKNRPQSGLREGYTSYKVEQIIDTEPQGSSNPLYQIYMTPYIGGKLDESQRTLITSGSDPITGKSGWHGFRTSFSEITRVGVWTNSGTDIFITDLCAQYLEGNTAEVTVNYDFEGNIEKQKLYKWRINDTFTYNAPRIIEKDGTVYYLDSSSQDLSKTVPGEGLTINVRYTTEEKTYGSRVYYYSLDNSGEGGITYFGNVEFQKGQKGNSLHLDGSSYALLPQGILSSLNSFTITGWFKQDSLSSWARVFDFGNNTNVNMFFTPYSADGRMVFAITTGGNSGEQRVSVTSPLIDGQWYHFAITLEGSTAALYIDGKEMANNKAMTLRPSSLGNTIYNYLGKSQYSDPNFLGNIDEIQIYNYKMDLSEIRKNLKETASKVSRVEDVYIYTESPVVTLPKRVEVTYENGLVAFAKTYWEQDTVEVAEHMIVEGKVYVSGEEYSVNAYITYKDRSLVEGFKVSSDIFNLPDKIVSSIKVEAENPENLYAMLGLYRLDGKLESMSIKEFSLENEASFELSLDKPSGGGTYLAKSFIWRKNMQPISQVVQREIQANEAGFFSLGDVKLLDGIFLESQNVGAAYLKDLDMDRLIAPYYEAAGLTPKKARYGGWESMQISGHSLGHYLSAVSLFYAATGDEEFKQRLDYIIDELAYIQSEYGNGYIGGVEETPFRQVFSGNFSAEKFNLAGYWVPWYNIHKTYQGLIDAFIHGRNKKALDVVVKFANWAKTGLDNLTDAQVQRMLNCEHGGMNEVFAELYDITGNESYLELAKRFTHNEILDPLSRKQDNLTGYHANTQIPKIIGAASIYENDPDMTNYKTAAQFFWDTVVKNRSYVFGGNSISEHFEALGAETLGIKTAESCNTNNMLKLTEHLYTWEQKKEYMDYFENALFNQILGSQDPLTGNKTYFTSTLQGHYRIYGTHDNSFWCCTGTGMENPAKYAKGIYFKSGNDLYVNLFISSRLTWRDKGIVLRQESDIPYGDKLTLTVEEGNAFANIKIRKPKWLAGTPLVYVNGESVENIGNDDYITLSKQWQAGDVIEVTLPMALQKYVAKDNPNKIAFTYGPIVLAGAFGSEGLPNDTVEKETGLDSTTTYVPTLICQDDILSHIELKDEETLTFEIGPDYTSNKKAVTLKPFFAVHHEFYTVYWYLNTNPSAFEKQLNDITIDSVIPDGQQDEIGHNLQSKDSNNGYFESGGLIYRWRDAWGSSDSFFSYDMMVDPDNNNYLYVVYWGSDTPFNKNGVSYTRNFDILVDGVKVGEQTLNNNKPNSSFYVFYAIPKEVTQGKDKVTVTFRVKNANTAAGGVFEVRTTTGVIQ